MEGQKIKMSPLPLKTGLLRGIILLTINKNVLLDLKIIITFLEHSIYMYIYSQKLSEELKVALKFK